MKHKLILSAIVICTVFFSNFKISAQDTVEKIKPGIFGLGVHLERYISDNNYANHYFNPANKIVFTITPVKYLRFEPEIGINYSKAKDNDLIDKTIYYGLGVFGMYQREKTNFYGGLRLGNVKRQDEYLNFNTNAKQTSESKTFSIGPIFGAEYFFGKHFSIGAEVGIYYFNLNASGDQFSAAANVDFIATDAGILFRFYF